MRSPPLTRLRARRSALGAPLCVGIDPHPDRLPDELPPTVDGVERFARELVAATAEHATAVKINVAFFEAFGAGGWTALERVRHDVPDDIVCILDAKRGDIGSTAERYAAGLFGHLEADAVTLSPYLGEDAIEPFLAYPDRLVYLLARTSNPSGDRVQGLATPSGPVHEVVAQWAAERWTDGRVGLVVGATVPDDLERLRAAVPGPAFLVPGVGAQGGDLVTAVRACDGAWAPGVVTVSRSIAEASSGSDWRHAAANAALDLRRRMAGAVLHSASSVASATNQRGS